MSVNIDDANDLISLASYPQAILHVDCDAFFASCEKAVNPGLRGLPIATGRERGIVSCPSYEAKAAGVERGMRIGAAKKACPRLIVIPSNYETYSIFSERLFAILRRFTPEVEEYSIDEAFCDLTGLRRLYRASYENIALQIKEAIQNELGITASVGLSLSKTLAKLCSKCKKPNGLTAVCGSRLHRFLRKVPLGRVCGFGPNTVALLRKCGLLTVLDYVRRPREFAGGMLGKIGDELWQELRGIQVYKVSSERKEKYLTISKTKTFMPASGDRDFVKAHLMRNLESAFIKLRRHGLKSRGLAVFLRKADFSSHGLEARITRHSSSVLEFTNLASGLFGKIFREGTAYRATGVVLSDIAVEGSDSPDLFDDPVKIERMRKVSGAIDRINSIYGKHAIHLAASDMVTKKLPHARNCLAPRKAGLLKGETFRKRLFLPLLRPR